MSPYLPSHFLSMHEANILCRLPATARSQICLQFYYGRRTCSSLKVRTAHVDLRQKRHGAYHREDPAAASRCHLLFTGILPSQDASGLLPLILDPGASTNVAAGFCKSAVQVSSNDGFAQTFVRYHHVGRRLGIPTSFLQHD